MLEHWPPKQGFLAGHVKNQREVVGVVGESVHNYHCLKELLKFQITIKEGMSCSMLAKKGRNLKAKQL